LCTRKAIEESARTICAQENDYGRCTGERVCRIGGLTACNARVPAAEVCNSVDSDCNGQTDDIPVVPCLIRNQYGACPGSTICESGKEVCRGTPPAQETCNGIDDNCNGQTDEAGSTGCRAYFRDSDEDAYGRSLDSQCLCAPKAPHTALQGGDCDDSDSQINPGAVEVCNGRDDDCNGQTDEAGADGCIVYYRDGDQDGYGITADAKCLCSGQAPYTSLQGGDCNDQDSNVRPGTVEVCNGKDDNCNGIIDPENSPGCAIFYYDGDGDAFGSNSLPARCLCSPDFVSKYTARVAGDCDDTDPNVNPGQIETCGDGIDNNCNGQIDEPNAVGCVTRFEDKDGDGYGTGPGLCTCAPTPPYTATQGGDCNDLNRSVNPGQAEVCGDAIDNNCNGLTDEEGGQGCLNHWYDFDVDTYGTGNPRCLCEPDGYWTARRGGDCDDENANANPGKAEICGNGIDDNCSGITDDEGATGCTSHFLDEDRDTFGKPGTAKCLCQPTGLYTATNGLDCDDTKPLVNPTATETCDGIDNNCNGLVDEEGAAGCVAFYHDVDGDGYGNEAITSKCQCGPNTLTKYTATTGGDCNDANPAIHPGQQEICEPDGATPIDNNCNGLLNEENAVGCRLYYYDNDGDGHGTPAQPGKCYCVPGNAVTRHTSLVNNDCNDNDPNIAPSLPEICGDNKDNNCNGQIDEEGGLGCARHYKDQDQDGYGRDDDYKCLCKPDTVNRYTALDGGDCLDDDPAVYPGASVCGKDGNCDGNLLDPGEECDDANSILWDGCSGCLVTEFRVNATTSDDQYAPAVAALTGGGYVIAFQSKRLATAEDVALRIIDADGKLVGSSDIWANSYTAGFQGSPSAASLPSNGFVAVWDSLSQDGGGYGVFGQRFDSAGAGLGAEFLVNGTTASDQRQASVASFPDGTFVVAWQSYLQDGSDNGVFARRMKSTGLPEGGEIAVNQTTAGAQDQAAIASLSDGRFFVVWRSVVSRDGGGSDTDIFLRRFSAAGVALADEQLVNTFIAGNQAEPAISVLGTDQIIVAWQSAGQDGSGTGVYAQRFGADGAKVGSEFRMNTTAVNDQETPTVAGLSNGSFIAAWSSRLQDGSGTGVYIQRFNSSNATVGSETRVNVFTTGDQYMPAIATQSGHFMASWASFLQDGSGHGTYGRRYNW
jgi:hypothetical protein